MGSRNQQTSLRSPGELSGEVLEGTTPRGSLTQWRVACVNDAMGLSQRFQILNHGQPYRFIKVVSICSWPFLRYATVLRQSHKSYWFYSCWIPQKNPSKWLFVPPEVACSMAQGEAPERSVAGREWRREWRVVGALASWTAMRSEFNGVERGRAPWWFSMFLNFQP